MPPELPDDVLISVFEDIKMNGPKKVQRMLPLLLVCRQWNVAIQPLVYQHIEIDLAPETSTLQALSESLSSAETRGQSTYPYIKTISIFGNAGTAKRSSSMPLETVQVPLKTILSRSQALRALCLYYTSHVLLRLYADILGSSLLHLTLHLPGPSSLQHVSAFVSLRTLRITTRANEPHLIPNKAHAWKLPALEEVRWDEIDLYSGVYIHPSTIYFLSLCRFPSLWLADLHIELENDDGQQSLSLFLALHSHIKALGIKHMDLWGCIPTSMNVQRLNVPVFFDSHQLGIDWFPTNAILDILSLHPRGVREVHLALGQRWAGRRDGKVKLGQEYLTFRFNEMIAGARKDELEAIHESALTLQGTGIDVYDESGCIVSDDK